MRELVGYVNRYLLPFALLAAISAVFTGCPSSPVKNSPGPGNGNTPAAVSPTAAPQTPKPEQNTASGSLATPTDAYRTAHALRAKKDAQGLKRVLSKDILEFFTEIGKVEKKSLDDMLMELCQKPQEATPESRNEKITGERAVIEYKDEKGEWKEMDFVKEGGEWKLTLPKADSPSDAQKKP